MQLRYGNYRFPLYGATVAASRDYVAGPDGSPVAKTVRFAVRGEHLGDGPLDVSRKVDAMLAALDVPGRDLVLAFNGRPVLQLLNRGSTTGVRVTHVEIPEDRSAWATYVPYSFVAEATFPLVAAESQGPTYTAWTETVRSSGGLPRYVFRECVNASPQEQKVSPQTTFKVTQSGSATALGFPPVPNVPMLDGPMRLVDREIVETASGPTFTVQWTYNFESKNAAVLRPRAVPR